MGMGTACASVRGVSGPPLLSPLPGMVVSSMLSLYPDMVYSLSDSCSDCGDQPGRRSTARRPENDERQARPRVYSRRPWQGLARHSVDSLFIPFIPCTPMRHTYRTRLGAGSHCY